MSPIQRLLRKLGLLSLQENLDFITKKIKVRKRNKIFVKTNPTFSIPPSHLAYDAYSIPDWEFYKSTGEESANYLKNIVLPYVDERTMRSILEWGCGPGRIIRHLPKAFGENVQYFGTDYNHESIDWCRLNLPGITFLKNDLIPPVKAPDNSFDFIYAISVFTHLSENIGLQWIEDLYRLLRPGGVILLSLKGDSCAEILSHKERHIYDTKGVFVWDDAKEGKKSFAAFHNPRYVKDVLLSKFSILKHFTDQSSLIDQDVWVARKDYLRG